MIIVVWALAAAGIGAAIAFGMVASARRLRSCPSCRTEMRELPIEPAPRARGADPARTYTVLFCATCPRTVTALHGRRSELAYCPACTQRALQIRPTRSPDGTHALVDEQCGICGYTHQRTLELQLAVVEEPPPANVIEFPLDRRRGAPAEEPDPVEQKG